MKSNKKIIFLLLLTFLSVEVNPQEKLFTTDKETIINTIYGKKFNNIPVINSITTNNSVEVLDSVICVSSSGNKRKLMYSYNNDLLLDFFTFSQWSDDEWIITDKHTNYYNLFKNLDSILSETHNPVSGQWRYDYKEIFNYDSSNNMISHILMLFNGQEFQNAFREINNYDTTNNLVLSLNQFWSDSVWVNDLKIINRYSQDNTIDTVLIQEWIDDVWVNSQLRFFEYNENLKIISVLIKTWQDSNWVDLVSGKFKYDFKNNKVLETFELAENNNWRNWLRRFYEYDTNNNLIHFFGKIWDDSRWVFGDTPLVFINPDGIPISFITKEIFLYYSLPTEVLEVDNPVITEYSLSQNYPNPFNPSTNIRYSIEKPGRVTLKVYDLMGKEVATLLDRYQESGSYDILFQPDNLSSGVYFYRITSGNYSAAKKLILLK